MKKLLLLLLCLGLTNVIRANEPPANSATASTPAPKRRGISLDFPGGTLSSLLAAITNAGEEPLNIIGEKDALAIQLPPFSVRNVDRGDSLINALVPFIRPQGYAFRQTGGNIWFVEKSNTDNLGRQNSLVVPVNMSPYLGAQTIDDIVAAIRLAWESSPSRDNMPIGLKFHPPTKLLLISGSPEAVQVAQTVIGSLTRNPAPAKPTPEPRPAPDNK